MTICTCGHDREAHAPGTMGVNGATGRTRCLQQPCPCRCYAPRPISGDERAQQARRALRDHSPEPRP
jgi:hypothetical protein